MAVHGFTHVDAPAHFIKGAPTIDQLPIDAYCGEAAVVNLTRVGAEQAIEPEDLEGRARHLRPGDIALLRTDWGRKEDWQSMAFWEKAPYLTEAACRWLVDHRVKAVGMDFPGDYILRNEVVDRRRHARPEENTTHQYLLAAGVGLVEYLTNLDAVTKDRVRFYALPLKIAGSDGSPVRAVAVEDE
jgi:kynurenine formamidase